MGASIKDVALRAGVSVKTVSNVINDFQFVSDATRAKVRAALEELDYRPNLSARLLRGGRTGVVALAVPEISSPYFAELAAQFVQQAKGHGWTVLVDETQGAKDSEHVVLEGIKSHLIDGLIVSPLALTAKEIDQRRDHTPLVLLGERLAHAPVDHVSIDNVAGATTATAHLIALGRRRIAAIGSQPHISGGTAALRLRGYRAALRTAKIRYDASIVIPAKSYHRADGYAAMHALLDLPAPPDAVFCFNDLLAIGALRALHERGRQVPSEVAVIGFDGIEEGEFHTPTLSTIRPDKAEIARLALALLERRITDGPAASPREGFASFELLARQSTARS
ncbi:LacI family DNA-binding transcriptional regulator [Paractinoplanes toevensis]|uniref:LacI family transcriptional regulator n=1 Tax=Paractinoplanes toevensis TaxID=571911 RepID=A0A919W9U3_9ACTN|nr:LacI family DNA-binding transcriptional regulator [Actinoplanes toevensis]GIM96197.1 LacI family transcriptional regulator [Actinoplanes toevensis]